MIRRAQAGDIPRLKQIWQICFGDSQDEIDFFFSQAFSPANVLLDDVHGAPVSALYLLDGAVVCGTQAYRGQYIYAAGTLPAYRGCGRMGLLLRAASDMARERGLDCLTLLPASRQLYGYYAGFGFQPFFRRACVTLERRKVQALSAPAMAADCLDLGQIKALRAASFSACGFWQWDEPLLAYAFDTHRRAGGSLVCTRRGEALFAQTGACAAVTELCAPAEEFAPLLALLLEACDAREFQLSLPDTGFFGIPADAYPHGMLLPLTQRAKQDLHTGAYLGLSLE